VLAPHHLVIRAGGSALDVRPITAADRDPYADAFSRLSDRSRLLRFFTPKKALTPRELTYFTEIDHHGHEALAARDRRDGRIVGVARYATVAEGADTAEVAVEVVDAWQGHGIGKRLLSAVIQRACENGLHRLVATTMVENRPARAILRRAGFAVRGAGDGLLELELTLEAER
jgi:RimJ/RimL family protein N-acetyltransferase